jgi:heme exporter protein C
MANLWWKILSALLVLFSLILGLRTPLSPGIPAVSPDRLNYGVTSVEITGYNTHFSENDPTLKVWVMNGKAEYCAYETAVVSPSKLRATFSVSENVQDAFFDLYVHSQEDGTMYLPSAFLQNGMEVSLNPGSGENCVGKLTPAKESFDFPNQPILNETLRNLLYHVPAWFAMIFIMGASLVFSIRFLRTGNLDYDIAASSAAHVGLLFAFIGLATGSIWARFTWGAWWVSDPRLNGAAIAVLIYLAYFVLRSSVNDSDKAGRLAAVYNIFAFVMMLLFVMVLPRLTDSLHPGVGGNPAFNQYDLDDNMRLVFYPAVIGWIGMSLWVFQIKRRIERLRLKQDFIYEI